MFPGAAVNGSRIVGGPLLAMTNTVDRAMARY